MSELFDDLVTASRNWPGDAPSGAMLTTMRAFLSAATKNDSLVREAAGSMSTRDPGSAAWIAVALGNLVERGAPADVSGPAVLEQLKTFLPDLPTPGDEEGRPPDPTPEQATLLAQFRFLCQSVVTHLARLPTRRQAMGQDMSLLDRLDELRGYSHGAWWVHEALLKTSGTLVLLHPQSGTGLRLWYANVSNNFHLFSLLQAAVGTVIPGGRKPDDAIAQVARGKSSDPVNDKAWWHYGDATSPKADLKSSLWGEGLVREIPRVDGEQVLLLWPPILESRGWSAGFLSPHLEAMPADAGVERMLTDAESKAWLGKLGIGRKRKRWWWF